MDKKLCLIIYHKADNDGLFSAVIAGCAVQDEGMQPVYMGMDYSDIKYLMMDEIVPQNKNLMLWKDLFTFDKVVLVDFSFPVDNLGQLYNHYIDNFIWCDHHRPIIEAAEKEGLNDLISGIRDCGHSALYNTYLYFKGEPPKSKVLNALQKYDSWTFDLEEFDEVFAINNAVVNRTGLQPHVTCSMYKDIEGCEDGIYESLLEEGRAINSYIKMRNVNMIKNNSVDITVAGDRKAKLVVFSQPSSSDMFESLDKSYKNGLVLKMCSDGSWSAHLYNVREDSGFHCGRYCRENYNGGGHGGAAGASISQEEAFKIITERKF